MTTRIDSSRYKCRLQLVNSLSHARVFKYLNLSFHACFSRKMKNKLFFPFLSRKGLYLLWPTTTVKLGKTLHDNQRRICLSRPAPTWFVWITFRQRSLWLVVHLLKLTYETPEETRVFGVRTYLSKINDSDLSALSGAFVESDLRDHCECLEDSLVFCAHIYTELVAVIYLWSVVHFFEVTYETTEIPPQSLEFFIVFS